MTFRDLPTDWEHRSLEDPVLAADVLDLVVSHADRRRGGVAVLFTEEGRLAQPMFLELDGPLPPEEVELVGSRVGWLAQHLDIEAQVLASVVRESGPFVTDDDRALHEALVAGCRDAGVPLLGMYLTTLHVVRPFPLSLTGRVTV